jgi:hypothetical protein
LVVFATTTWQSIAEFKATRTGPRAFGTPGQSSAPCIEVQQMMDKSNDFMRVEDG